MNKIVKAKLENVDYIVDMINLGRKHIQEYGIDQWGNGYPNKDTILQDIENDRGYLFIEDDNILAYFVVLDYDPCYEYIEGKWNDQSDYVAIHRVVTCEFNKGVGSKLFAELKNRYAHIRVDTHEGNISMNKCLIKNGFEYCGVIYLSDGAARNAYEFVR